MLDLVNETVRSVLSDQPMPRLDDDQALVEQGITSLLTAELCSRLESAAHVPVPATVLYSCPSIRRIAAYLEQARGASSPAPVQQEARRTEAGFDFLDNLEPGELADLIARELNGSPQSNDKL
jgi:acyl carrier protein